MKDLVPPYESVAVQTNSNPNHTMKMKTSFRATLTTLVAALLAAITTTSAQSSWQTVADFQCAPPAAVDALAKDAAGNLYAAISTSDAEGRMHAVIRKSSDHGATWTVVEDYLHPGQSATRYLSLGVDATDNLYAAGYAENSDGQTRWIVRKSGSGGGSWSTVDDFVWPSGQRTLAQGFAADVLGNLYVAGYADESLTSGQAGRRAHWLVRQSRDGGRTWATIDDFASNFSAKAFAIASTGNGLFVAGSGWNGDRESGERWLVRKGTPDGAGGFHWQSTDDYQGGEPGKWSEAIASGLSVDARGNVYAVGRGYAPPGGHAKAHWIVRRADKEGSDWTVVDSFQLEPECYAAALGVTVDTQSGVYVVGQARAETGIHWIVRHSATGDPGSWNVSDNFGLMSPPLPTTKSSLIAVDSGERMMATSPNETSKGIAILNASSGVFAGGSAFAGPGHAIVRKLELNRAGKLTASSER